VGMEEGISRRRWNCRGRSPSVGICCFNFLAVNARHAAQAAAS
jgi:hypothetical protein